LTHPPSIEERAGTKTRGKRIIGAKGMEKETGGKMGAGRGGKIKLASCEKGAGTKVRAGNGYKKTARRVNPNMFSRIPVAEP